MHLTGKIFAFLTILLAIGAIILTAQTLDRQNEWNQRVEKAREDYQAVVVQVPKKKQNALTLRDELTKVRLDWGRHWDDVQVGMRNAEQGQITIGIGRNNKIARQTDAGEQFPIIQAFQPTADGQMKYVGEFRVTQIDATQAALQLTREPREGETASWDVNTLWRFRDAMPASKKQQVSNLLLELTLIEQRLKDRLLNLQIQQKSAQAAQESLDQRLKELQGDPDLPAEVGDEYRLGLVDTIRQAEAARDASLAQVQQLRVELRDLYEKFESLIADNKALEQQLSEQAGVDNDAETSASSDSPAKN